MTNPAKEIEKLCIDAFNNEDKQQALTYLQQCSKPSEIVTNFFRRTANCVGPRDILTISNVSLLHIAAKNNWPDVVSTLITRYHCNPEAKNNRMSTPLHYAARYGSMETLKCLITQHNCNPMSFTKNGWTALHWAASTGQVDALRYLIEECNCDPSLCDAKRHTLLHLACAGNHIEAARYLLKTGLIDPAITCIWNCRASEWGQSTSNGNTETIELLKYYEECRMNSPIDTYTQVFVLGNKGAGKSTLVKVLKIRSEANYDSYPSESEDGNVTNVTLNTIGIVPENITSSEIGNMTVYDLSGDAEYHFSHSMIMKTATKAGLALFILVVDISQHIQTVEKQIHYWFNYLCTMCGTELLSVLIAGSHQDVLRDKDDDKANAIEALISKEYPQTKTTFIPMDCRKVQSKEIIKISQKLLLNSLSSIQKSVNTNYNCHALYSFLKSIQQCYCTLGQLSTMISTSDKFLPPNEDDLAKLLAELSVKGLILFLKKEFNLCDSWVIINIKHFLNEVNGLLFSPKHDLSSISNIGLVPISWIKATFPEHSPLTLSDILHTLEVCQVIDSNNADVAIPDRCLFFPSFVPPGRPNSLPSHNDFDFVWHLECIHYSRFFPTQFCHMFILRLALTFPLQGIKRCSSPVSPQVSRRCQMWKFGIYWNMDDFVEILVELSKDMQRVTVKIKWHKNSMDSIKAMMKLRSSIIKTIFCLHRKYCSSLEVGEFLEMPGDSVNHHQFAMQDIVRSICLKKEGVLSSDTSGSKVERLDKILLHEPLVSLPQGILFKIFHCCNTDLLIEPDLLKQLNQSLKPLIIFAREQKISIVDVQSHIEEYSLFCERTIVQKVI